MATFEPHGAQVDVEASVVRVADQSWPFELDPASGDARLLLTDARGGAGAFWLRPLHWREKITLARFAHLGPAFLSRQLLRLTARGDGPLPDDPARAAALSALAAWINDPMGDGVSLPLDPLALARAALGVCRASALSPADLDERDALEVELYWQAIRGANSTTLPGSEGVPRRDDHERDGLTRIVVLPDRPVAGSHAQESAEPQPDAPRSIAAPQPPACAADDAGSLAVPAARGEASGSGAYPEVEGDGTSIPAAAAFVAVAQKHPGPQDGARDAPSRPAGLTEAQPDMGAGSGAPGPGRHTPPTERPGGETGMRANRGGRRAVRPAIRQFRVLYDAAPAQAEVMPPPEAPRHGDTPHAVLPPSSAGDALPSAGYDTEDRQAAASPAGLRDGALAAVFQAPADGMLYPALSSPDATSPGPLLPEWDDLSAPGSPRAAGAAPASPGFRTDNAGPGVVLWPARDATTRTAVPPPAPSPDAGQQTAHLVPGADEIRQAHEARARTEAETTRDEREAWFEELSERLAQAAAELGIDIEM